MIAYIDSSVVLRIILDQRPRLEEWHALELGVSSPLLRVECLRTLDRLWREGVLDEESLVIKRSEAESIVRRLVVVPLDQRILDDASRPLPSILGTLDAIHLVSAMTYRRQQPDDERSLLFATHDRALAKAATEMNFEVLGAPA